jgi:hypothetical protein
MCCIDESLVSRVGDDTEASGLHSTASRPALGPTQHPVQWVSGALSPGVKRLGREADHSLPSGADDENDGAIPPLPHTY